MGRGAKHHRTRNGMGWTSRVPNQVTEALLAACGELTGPVLEIGAAFGVAARPLAAAGARVIANDVAMEHLRVLREEGGAGIDLLCGRFPELGLAAGSLGAVHASNVLHFLTGEELREGFARMFGWLRPGGRVYIQASTPYQRPFAGFGEEYAARVERGEEWPGWVDDTARVTSFGRRHQYPAAIHLLDDRVLERELGRAGFTVERLWLYRRHELPASLFLDGREQVGAIARKG